MERNELIGRLKKRFTNLIADDGSAEGIVERAGIFFMSTGILPFDMALGGGYPRGNITHIFGPDGAGKTTSMISAVISAQQSPIVNGLTLYLANEPKVDETMFYRLGVDPEKIIFAKTRSIDNPLDGNKALNMVRDAVGQVELIVLDSVAGLSPSVMYDMNSEDYAIGKIARLLSDQLPLIANLLAATPTVFIMLNQERASFATHGAPTKPFAGYALKHWIANSIWIRRSRWVYKDGKSKGEVIGFAPKVTTQKNDYFAPKKDMEWEMLFETGVNRVQAAFDCANSCRLLRQAKGYKLIIEDGEIPLDYPDGPHDKNTALDRLGAEPDLLELLERSVRQTLGPSRTL